MNEFNIQAFNIQSENSQGHTLAPVVEVYLVENPF